MRGLAAVKTASRTAAHRGCRCYSSPPTAQAALDPIVFPHSDTFCLEGGKRVNTPQLIEVLRETGISGERVEKMKQVGTL